MKDFDVIPIGVRDTYDLLMNVHYARRIPSISYAFGLMRHGFIVGCCTFGTPSSAPARAGLMGPERAQDVLELNRLALAENHPHVASWFVARCLKLLPRPKLVVSFADTAQGHVGTVYQAANFAYTGLSAKRTDWRVDGLEHLHGQTIADQFRGQPDRAKAAREHYGERFRLVPRSRKHRYVYPVGSRKERREMMAALRYPVLPYPKP